MKTRRSTSSPCMMLGRHLLAALTKCASGALGAVAMAADLAKVVKPRVRVDATTSKAIASRRGVGRARYLHTQVLWVQEEVDRRELTIARVPGCENPDRFRHETLGSDEDARVHEKSRLPDRWRMFEGSVEGRKRVRFEPATLLGLRNRQAENIVT